MRGEAPYAIPTTTSPRECSGFYECHVARPRVLAKDHSYPRLQSVRRDQLIAKKEMRILGKHKPPAISKLYLRPSNFGEIAVNLVCFNRDSIEKGTRRPGATATDFDCKVDEVT